MQNSRITAECRGYQQTIVPASRVVFCSRCGHATGTDAGHSTVWCRRTGRSSDVHLCCPESCEFAATRRPNPVASCHPAPGTYDTWAVEQDARHQAFLARVRQSHPGDK